MNVLETIEHLQKTWASLIPHIAVPPSEDVGRWCNYPTTIVEQAMLRTARKFSASKVDINFDGTAAYRYTTGVARSIADQSNQRVGAA